MSIAALAEITPRAMTATERGLSWQRRRGCPLPNQAICRRIPKEAHHAQRYVGLRLPASQRTIGRYRKETTPCATTPGAEPPKPLPVTATASRREHRHAQRHLGLNRRHHHPPRTRPKGAPPCATTPGAETSRHHDPPAHTSQGERHAQRHLGLTPPPATTHPTATTKGATPCATTPGAETSRHHDPSPHNEPGRTPCATTPGAEPTTTTTRHDTERSHRHAQRHLGLTPPPATTAPDRDIEGSTAMRNDTWG